MASKTRLFLLVLLVLVFAFSATVTMYTTAAADPPPSGCCNLLVHCPDGSNMMTIGIWDENHNCVSNRELGTPCLTKICSIS